MDEKRQIKLATEEELSNEIYYRRLWIAARNVPIGRRAWLDELADAYRDFGGQVRDEYDRLTELPFVDEVFPDYQMRWLSDYLEAAPSGVFPRRITRRYDRLSAIDLYFKIRHPRIARHFSPDTDK